MEKGIPMRRMPEYGHNWQCAFGLETNTAGPLSGPEGGELQPRVRYGETRLPEGKPGAKGAGNGQGFPG